MKKCSTLNHRVSVYFKLLRIKKKNPDKMEASVAKLHSTNLHWGLRALKLSSRDTQFFTPKASLLQWCIHCCFFFFFFSVVDVKGGSLWDYLSSAVASQLVSDWQPVALSTVLLRSRSVREREQRVRVRTKAEPCLAKGMRLTEGYLEIAQIWLF